ncbi:HlyD family type I secretion periplasmic adaptor subunit [Bosea caraganae]|uniref:Membrane fusion protein (MFP) family protein n=1 Tax=Bosea caraganae TaxID=2763117 RepID=A0A370L6X7_9HYPH|nr:HlyD family type I secretion periplasmic adaptor subunit [Bosea caraganae]RDJ25505.1 HlyD family type I secretion periplasmic adaptor subunit [Bosea caraganae]RDJ25708.1 HlyD family type I secretion periplasmic adaptor subunit [Bosea caraganae]
MSAANLITARPDYVGSLRRQQRIGLTVIAVFAGALGLWSATTTLQGAVAASGNFVVASDVKKVQHPSGGVVGELLVREGQRVEAGDILLRLDETVARANYQIVSKQLDEFAVRTLRLEAERDGAQALQVTPELEARRDEPAITRLIAAETRLFEVRRGARDGQRAQLRKRVMQLRDEITGLRSQQAAKEREAAIIAVELVGVEDLYKRNLIQLTRLSTLQREQASIEGQRGQLIAGAAQSEGKIAETELQIIQIDEDQRAEAMKELREIQGREGELVERRSAAQDQLRRIDLRAPSSGIVHQLAVHTVGGVLQPGEPAMLIVPREDDLQLEIRVSPTDIDQINLDQTVRVKVQAGNQSSNPELVGTVLRESPDITRDERQGTAYYIVRVALPRSEVARLAPLRVIAGMQAEAFIETEARTPIAFLLKPISTQLGRTFRER